MSTLVQAGLFRCRHCDAVGRMWADKTGQLLSTKSCKKCEEAPFSDETVFFPIEKKTRAAECGKCGISGDTVSTLCGDCLDKHVQETLAGMPGLADKVEKAFPDEEPIEPRNLRVEGDAIAAILAALHDLTDTQRANVKNLIDCVLNGGPAPIALGKLPTSPFAEMVRLSAE